MAEYIERESLEQDIKQYSHARIDNDAIDQMGFQFVEEMISILRIVEKQPTADVAEVKHGEWITPTKIKSMNIAVPHCSLCGNVPCDKAFYCPYCGAKMDKKEGAEE